MFPNLEYLLRMNQVTRQDLGWALHLCRNSIINKCHGHTQWKADEMRQVQQLLAPDLSLDVIFGRKFTLGSRRKKRP